MEYQLIRKEAPPYLNSENRRITFRCGANCGVVNGFGIGSVKMEFAKAVPKEFQ